jgi:hypothetical protein
MILAKMTCLSPDSGPTFLCSTHQPLLRQLARTRGGWGIGKGQPRFAGGEARSALEAGGHLSWHSAVYFWDTEKMQARDIDIPP